MTKRFRDQPVIEGVTLRCAAGDRVAVLGVNGAGKTTLMRCVLGLTRFDGRILVDGIDVGQEGRRARARIGYVPQRAPVFPGSLDDMVRMVADLRGLEVDDVRHRLSAMGLDLAAHGPKSVAALSGGMLQKVVLGLALAGSADVLLLDEPTANLDPRARREVIRLVNEVAPDVTVLLASHRLSDVTSMANRVVVLDGGSLVFDDTLTRFLSSVGREPVFWIEVTDGARDRAVAALGEQFGTRAIRRNGAALGLPLDALDPAAALTTLRELDVRWRSCWTEAPSLDDILDGLTERGPGGGTP